MKIQLDALYGIIFQKYFLITDLIVECWQGHPPQNNVVSVITTGIELTNLI